MARHVIFRPGAPGTASACARQYHHNSIARRATVLRRCRETSARKAGFSHGVPDGDTVKSVSVSGFGIDHLARQSTDYVSVMNAGGMMVQHTIERCCISIRTIRDFALRRRND